MGVGPFFASTPAKASAVPRPARKELPHPEANGRSQVGNGFRSGRPRGPPGFPASWNGCLLRAEGRMRRRTDGSSSYKRQRKSSCRNCYGRCEEASGAIRVLPSCMIEMRTHGVAQHARAQRTSPNRSGKRSGKSPPTDHEPARLIRRAFQRQVDQTTTRMHSNCDYTTAFPFLQVSWQLFFPYELRSKASHL